MKKITLSYFFRCCLLFAIGGFLNQNISAKEIFVDVKNVSGIEDGSIANPFKTIAQATAVALSGDVLTFRAGVYREEVLIPADRITFQAYPNEEVILNGTEILTAWTQVGSSAVYRTLMKWNTDSINGGNQLFVDQKMIQLCRWPDQTSADIVKPTDAIAESVTASGNFATIVDNEFDQPDGRWVGAQIWINLSHNGTDGEGWTGIVTATSIANHSITVDYRQAPVLGDKPWGLGKNTEYYLFNPTPTVVKAAGIETLLGAGEWWKDADTLYVSCPNAAAPGAAAATQNVVEAKKRMFAFSSSDAQVNRSYTVIRNFSLFAATITTDNNYKIRRAEIVEDAHDILIEGINGKYLTHFTNQTSLLSLWTGQTGIILSGVSNTLRNSTFQYSAGPAVSIMGFGSKLMNCSILDANYSNSNAGAVNCGYLFKDGEIAYNTISNTPMIAIHFTGLVNSNMKQRGVARIHHNVVKNFLRRGYDSGAIDECGHDGQWLRIDHNEIFNTMADADGDSRNGIYLDFGGGVGINEGHYILDHNSIYNVRNSVLLNNIKDILAYNNLTLTNDLTTLAFHNGNGGTGVGDTIRNNIMTNMPNIDCCVWGSLKDAVVENNITNAQGTVLDDLFVDAANNNYQLKATATAAIDKGVDFSPFNDLLVGAVPDLGPYEYGKAPWLAGVGTAISLPPSISPNGGLYEGSIAVALVNAGSTGVIRYTLDGSDPTSTSPEYLAPFSVTDTTVVKSRSFVSETEFSEVSTANFYVAAVPNLPLRPAQFPTAIFQGVNYEYYEWEKATQTAKLPDLETWTPVRVGVASLIDALTEHRADYIAYRFTGYLEVPVDGIYTLYTKSDDNSILYIGDTLVVDNDKNHPATEMSGRIGLKAGKHALRVDFKDNSGAESLSVSYKGPNISKRFVTADMLWHQAYVARTAKVAFTPSDRKFSNTVYVKMSCTTPESQIYYTTDGSTPTTASTLYTDSLPISTTANFKAIAYKASMPIPQSMEAAVTFTPSVSRVKILPNGGTYTDFATVTLSTVTTGATMTYTLDGSNPTIKSTVYTAPLKIDASGLLKTRAYKEGLGESYMDSAAYVIRVASPVYTPTSGTFTNTQMISISCITPGASIYYSINESVAPTANSTSYTGPFEISSSCYIKAVCLKPGLSSSLSIKKAYTLATGIDDISSSNLTVYPNPSSDGCFTLKLPEIAKSEKVVLQVANYLGQIIYKETIPAGGGDYKFPKPLNNGCYLLMLNSTSIHKTAKLIVK